MHTQSTVLDTPPEGGAQRRENIEHPTNPCMDCRHAREKQGSQTWHTALWRGQRAGGRRGKEGQARASDADAVAAVLADAAIIRDGIHALCADSAMAA